jgi:hypothetical protein
VVVQPANGKRNAHRNVSKQRIAKFHSARWK